MSVLFPLLAIPAVAQQCWGSDCNNTCAGPEFITYASCFAIFLCLSCCTGFKHSARGAKAATCVFIVLAITFGAFMVTCLVQKQSQEAAWLITIVSLTATGLCALCVWCCIKISDDDEKDVCNFPLGLAGLALLGLMVTASVFIGLRPRPVFSATNSVVCARGLFWSGTECSYCPFGYYCPGMNERVVCPPGTWTSTMASEISYSCTPCEAGFYCINGAKQQCPPGYFCPPGYSAPIACPAGSYGAVSGLRTSACSGFCPTGYYAIAGQSMCSPCACKNGAPCNPATGCVCPSGGTWSRDCFNCAPGYWGIQCNRECEGGAKLNCGGGVCSSGMLGNGTCSCPSGTCGSPAIDVCGHMERSVYTILLGTFFALGVLLACCACCGKSYKWDQCRLAMVAMSCFCVCLGIIASVTLGLCNAQGTSQEFVWVLSGLVTSLTFGCCTGIAMVACKDEFDSAIRKRIRIAAVMMLSAGIVFGILLALKPLFTPTCTDGTYLGASSNLCEICPKGAYCPRGELMQCAEGTFSNKVGQARPCINQCAAGYYCPRGSSAPLVCPIGSYCPAQSGNHILCPPFTYGSTPGLSTHVCSGSCPFTTQPGARECTNTSRAPTRLTLAPSRTPTTTPTSARPTSRAPTAAIPTAITPTPVVPYPTSTAPTPPSRAPSPLPPSLAPTRFPTTNASSIDTEQEGHMAQMDQIVIGLISVLSAVCVLCSGLYCYQSRKVRKLKSRMLSVPLVDNRHNSECFETSDSCYVPLSIASVTPSAPPPPVVPSAPPMPPQEAKEEAPTCVICLDGARSMAFYPCGHKVSCENCADKVSSCPICRSQIDKRLKIYE